MLRCSNTGMRRADAVLCADPVLHMQDTVQSAFKSTGVDINSITKTTSVVTKTAEEGVTAAKPLLSQAANFLTTTEPVSVPNHAIISKSVFLLGSGGYLGFRPALRIHVVLAFANYVFTASQQRLSTSSTGIAGWGTAA